MSAIVAAVFDGAATASAVLERLRAEGRWTGPALAEACALRREADGRLRLEEAIGRPGARRLPHGFWQRLLSHLLTGEPPAREGAAHCFGRPFCEAVAEALGPDRSVIFLHLEAADEQLLRALEAEGGRLLRAPAAPELGELVRRLEETLIEVPSAEALARAAEAAENERVLQARARQLEAEAARRAELERLRAETVVPAEIALILQRCALAARRGARRLAVLTFPAELLEDRGRRILQGEPDWPTTLSGRPRAFYSFFANRLASLGYRMEAEVAGYEDGVPARFALVLDWSRAGAGGVLEQPQEALGGPEVAL